MMRYDAEGRKNLDLVQAEAARKLAEIHQMLAPGIEAPFADEELQRQAHRHMAALPPAEQEKFKQRAIVAYAQLQRLIAEMSRHLSDVGDELRKVNNQSRAVGAYAQTAKKTGRRSPYAF